MNRSIGSWALALCAAMPLMTVVAGCGRDIGSTPRQLADPQRRLISSSHEDEYLLAIIVDLSGSFQDEMVKEGKAYDFMMKLLNRFTRDRVGMPDRVILAQVSGNDRPLLYEGTPQDLRRDFASAAAFRDFLLAKADPNGSRVYAGIDSAVRYVMADSAVKDGRARPSVFVVSDFIDTTPRKDEAQRRLLQSLGDLARHNDARFGAYYVDQHLVPEWRRHLRDAGFREVVVQSEIVGHPVLPDFE